MGGLAVLQPLRSYWVTAPVVLPPSPPLSPSPVTSFRRLRCEDANVGVAGVAAPCMRLYSQPSLPSTPVKVLRQVSVPVFSTNSFPRTPRVDFRDFQPPQRSTLPFSVDTAESPRNTIQPASMVPPTPPTPREPRENRGCVEPDGRVPVKIRVVTAPLKKREPATPPLERVSPAPPVERAEPPTLLRSRGAAVKKQLELSRQKAEEIRAIERKWREVAAEQRRLEGERLRLEAERQRAQMQQKTGEERQRRWRESLAEDLRRLAEEKRRVRREEQEEVERKRVEAQRSRQEAASRRLHRSLVEKHRLAEEARRAIEEGRRRRFSSATEAGRSSKAETHRGHRLSEVHRRHSAHEGSKRRAKSADADQECEAERRKAEQERQRKEEEERKKIPRDELNGHGFEPRTMPRLRAFFASREANLPSKKSETDLPEKLPTPDVQDVQDAVTDGGHQGAGEVADSKSDSGESWPPLDAGEEVPAGDRADLNSDWGFKPRERWDWVNAVVCVMMFSESCKKLESDLPEKLPPDVPDIPETDGGHDVACEVADSKSDSGESWHPLDAGEENHAGDRADLNSDSGFRQSV
eukprot:s311_g16.t1